MASNVFVCVESLALSCTFVPVVLLRVKQFVGLARTTVPSWRGHVIQKAMSDSSVN